jgi:hypothetical protein
MILKNTTSKLAIVNLLADFILNKIPKEEESIIQVIDCQNFYVIKGKTTHKEPLDIISIKDEFIKKFESNIGELKPTHSIDLIEYNASLNKKNELTFTYHNSINCSYHHKQINEYKKMNELSYDYNFSVTTINEEDNLVFCSEFPHGYSLGQGRLLYYYGKNIMYKIPPTYPVSTLTFNMSNNKTEDGEPVFSVIDNFYGEENETLTSAILDVFDFNTHKLEMEIKKVDWSIEVTNPLQDYSFLKTINKDFIIL